MCETCECREAAERGIDLPGSHCSGRKLCAERTDLLDQHNPGGEDLPGSHCPGRKLCAKRTELLDQHNPGDENLPGSHCPGRKLCAERTDLLNQHNPDGENLPGGHRRSQIFNKQFYRPVRDLAVVKILVPAENKCRVIPGRPRRIYSESVREV